MKNILFLMLLCSVAFSAWAQDFDTYKPLRAQGEIPIHLRTATRVKIEKEVSQIPFGLSYSEQKARREFAELSNYSIDQLLLSGKILFNDPVTQYVTKVGKKILEQETNSFSDSISFYVLRSDLTNAFATNQGLVFVTLGLLAQLQNEAELAFVLAHEIGHIKRKHVINNYVKSKQLYRNQGSKYYAHNDIIKELSGYSKAAEIEADSMAFLYLKTMPYSTYSMLTIYDVLQYSYLPFDEIKYDISYLEPDNYSLSEYVKQDTTMAITATEDYDDSRSTHPNILTRKEKLKSYAKKHNMKFEVKQDYIIGQEAFQNAKKLSRFETIRINLRDRDYVKALYNIEVLQKGNPTSSFLKVSKCKALYGLTKYKTAKKYRRVSDDWDDYEGEISYLYRVIEETDKKDFHPLVIKYLYNENKSLKNSHVKAITRDLIWDLSEELDWTYESLSDHIKNLNKTAEELLDSIGIDTSNQKISGTAVIDESKLSKYEKIKLKQSKQTIEAVKTSSPTVEDLAYIALTDEFKDTSFVNLFKKTEASYIKWDAKNKSRSKAYDDLSSYEKKKYKQNERQTKLHEGISDVLIVDPFFYKIDEKKGFKMLASEPAQIEFNENIVKVGEKAGVDIQLLSSKNLDPNSIEEFVDMSLLYDWIGERTSHDEIYFLSSENEHIKHLADKYNTKNIMFTGIVSYRERKEYVAMTLLASAIMWPTFPFVLAYVIMPEYHTYFYNFTLNIKNGEILINHSEELKTKPKTGYINSVVYDHFLQIQKEADEQ